VRIRELIQAVAKAKETLVAREDVEKRLRKLVRSRDKVIAVLRKCSRARHALLTLAGVADEKGFKQAAADASRVADLKRQQGELTLRIQTTLASGFTEETVGAVFKAEGRDVKGCWERQQKKLADIRARLAQIHERRGACTQEMQSLAADRQLAHATLELGAVEAQLADAKRRWKILSVIGRLLEMVRQRYETDRQPETLREASQYLVRLTDGHYKRVWMPLDRGGLLVENDRGESLSLDVLSRGTREAVFIGLRLALTGSFARRGATLPLVLDDVLVNFDTERVKCAAQVLCDFSRHGHQVIMFTCHEHITDIFEEAGGAVRLLPSRDGSVRRRRAKTVVEELPPPTPSATPEEPVPVRLPVIDPNPLLQMAACELLYDPVHPLPERPKRKRPRSDDWSDLHALSQAWRSRFWSLREPAVDRTPELKLPDYWPLAEISKPKPTVAIEEKPVVAAAFVPETFEVLAYRSPAEIDEAVVAISHAEPESATIVFSGAEIGPPAPKRLARRRKTVAEKVSGDQAPTQN
jgi:hypothetical protein